MAQAASPELQARIQEQGTRIQAVLDEVGKVVVGQRHMVNRLLVGLFTNGHVLLEGVPGLAKTLTISTLSQSLALSFKRIQFTPDLLPADLMGTLIYNQPKAQFEVKKGPIFANIVLADEINRAPAKVQSALLEAMQEKQVTIGETTFKLDRPFLVLATQNPVDQEGTYPLPEAQVDRFMMRIFVDYPTKAEELEILRRMAHPNVEIAINQVLGGEQIMAIRQLIEQVSLEENLERYIVDVIAATRQPAAAGLKDLEHYIEFGASPRAGIAIHLAARTLALMDGRTYVMPDDVKEVIPDCLNHRLLLSYEAEAENVSAMDCIRTLLENVAIPQ